MVPNEVELDLLMATKWVPVSACLIFTSGAVPPNHANQLITIPENQSGTPSNTGMEWNGMEYDFHTMFNQPYLHT